MQRVLILGSPGSGKSTLARRLAAITGLPLVHLDQIYWRPYWVEPSKPEWQQQLALELAKPAWIMDGNYGSTLAQRLTFADTVIFLDISRWLCLGRVCKRALTARGRTRPDMQPDCPERLNLQFFKFLLYIWRFCGRNRVNVVAQLDHFSETKIILHTTKEIEHLLQTIQLKDQSPT